jgi:multicomponent K+:H+ antiporter subunit E
MNRLFPAPGLSLALLAVWLVLNETLHPAHVALGCVLGIVIPWWTNAVRTELPRLRNPQTAVKLMFTVLPNIQVAKLILGPQSRLQPGFVEIPLTLRDAHGIATLAGMITMTPGTLSADISADQRTLTVHALHVPDPAALIDDIRIRYEQPLMKIFQ